MTSADPSPRATSSEIAFDADARVLANSSGGAQKFLSRNEARLLELLTDGPQTKEALIQGVWGEQGVVVTDASYYQLVTQLRNSFSEVGLSRQLIHTIPRYGLELRDSGPAADGVALDEEQGERETEELEVRVPAERGDGAATAAEFESVRVPEAQASAAHAADAQLLTEAVDTSVDEGLPEPIAPVVPPRAEVAQHLLDSSRAGAWHAWRIRLPRWRYVSLSLVALVIVVIGIDSRWWRPKVPALPSDPAWVARDVAGARVFVKGAGWSTKAIAEYISRADKEPQCTGPSPEEYYLRRTGAATELLIYGYGQRPCATYCFY